MQTRTYNEPIKDKLISQIAGELELPPELCENVLMWSYKKAKEATNNNNIIELSGFGKLMVSQFKLRKKQGRIGRWREKLLQHVSATEEDRVKTERKLHSAEAHLEFLKQKERDV